MTSLSDYYSMCVGNNVPKYSSLYNVSKEIKFVTLNDCKNNYQNNFQYNDFRKSYGIVDNNVYCDAYHNSHTTFPVVKFYDDNLYSSVKNIPYQQIKFFPTSNYTYDVSDVLRFV
jgi:hypothetical protein